MKLGAIKKRMKKYRDFHGNDLIGVDDIDSAKNINELVDILENHRAYLEQQLTDASTDLDKFKKDIGVG